MIVWRLILILYSSPIVFPLHNGARAEIVVTCINHGEINTVFRDVKLRGISFQKRSIDLSSQTSAEFTVNNVANLSDYEFHWELDNESITAFVTRYTSSNEPPVNPPELYTIESLSNNTLNVTLVLRRRRLVPGVYKLTVSHNEHTGSAVAVIKAPPILPEFSKIKTHLPGDRLSILCSVTGYPLPMRVNWSFAPVKRELMKDFSALSDAQSNLRPLEEMENMPYTFVSNDVENEQLLFEELPEDYGGLYQCHVTQSNYEDRSLILVHIKDRYAAIWPFIGIVIEVMVLVIGILLYERHQMRPRATPKTEAPAADVSTKAGQDPSMMTGATPQQNNISGTGEPQVDTVRHGDNRLNSPDAGDDVRMRSMAHC